MVLILLVTVLVLAVAFYQVVQGVYSALVMLLASLISAAVAFTYFEPLSRALAPYLDASSQGVALAGLFAVCLVALRLAADQYLRANVTVGPWANRIGAGALGLLSGMLVLGVVATALQLLPAGTSILTFRPFNDAMQRSRSLGPFKPDEFTIGLMKLMSGNGFRSSGEMLRVHDNLLQEAFGRRNQANLNGGAAADPKSLTVPGLYTPPDEQLKSWADQVPLNPLLEDRSAPLLFIVRTAVDASAADPDRQWRLPGTHYRLVAKDGRSAYPVAYLYAEEGSWRLAVAPPADEQGQALPTPLTLLTPLAVARSQGAQQRLVVDWVFRVEDNFVPDSMCFRMISWAAVPSPPQEQMPPLESALAAVAPAQPAPRPATPPAPPPARRPARAR